MTLRFDLLELASAMFHTCRQTTLKEFFAGKENPSVKYWKKRLKFNFISLSNTFF